jgi:hypothetical protein
VAFSRTASGSGAAISVSKAQTSADCLQRGTVMSQQSRPTTGVGAQHGSARVAYMAAPFAVGGLVEPVCCRNMATLFRSGIHVCAACALCVPYTSDRRAGSYAPSSAAAQTSSLAPVAIRNSYVLSEKLGCRVASEASPCGTKIAIPWRARVKSTRYELIR